jgi:hypothetical protein
MSDKLGWNPVVQDGYLLDSGIYLWLYDYNPDFIGCMKDVLKLEEFILN